MRNIRISRPGWFDRALCRHPDDEAARQASIARHFPAKGRSGGAARDECARCPVRSQCLDMALADASLTGIWAGTSELERDALRTRRRIA